MSGRIRDLEDALRKVHTEKCHLERVISRSHLGSDPGEDVSPITMHPLLSQELLLVKNHVELYDKHQSMLLEKTSDTYSRQRSGSEVTEKLGDCLSVTPNSMSELSTPLIIPSREIRSEVNLPLGKSILVSKNATDLSKLFPKLLRAIFSEEKNQRENYYDANDTGTILSEIYTSLPSYEEAKCLCETTLVSGHYM